ncbi:hypothetical protein PF005_g28809 [Phytophthora fragariae]|uniref:Crinkler effector protein N-terminal domain-containing protein n=1 Tax=Phytophthora fragariae TaxID=53985 RepID=A0A6A3DUI3_9STRA|nr:hypothetical protein PF003_g856 [Phytophthora fragariae]KAE8922080.1 hypothetical protein PF009_g27646 [Phytophthora fragariae]KAE8965773.1 hypothetical protein PF011_g28166 [Phytophthora fragariae]KAE9064948.1 hypothetical protein PF010_g28412 [Phytophthora fragariae]KAE9075452.1 hypothetical protein PF006_g28328 [Phytophthora fragariae]
MVKVELGCGVYGEGSVFSVENEHNAKVSALQKAIFDKQRYNHQRKFDFSMLTLYLARKKEGEETKWLADDDNLDTLLGGDVDKQYEEMRPTWTLDDEAYFGSASTETDSRAGGTPRSAKQAITCGNWAAN